MDGVNVGKAGHGWNECGKGKAKSIKLFLQLSGDCSEQHRADLPVPSKALLATAQHNAASVIFFPFFFFPFIYLFIC